MARFILDIGNLGKEQIEKVMKTILEHNFVGSRISTITCIDETNENQFNETTELNSLTKKQIETYDNSIHPFPSIELIKKEGKFVTDYETQDYDDTAMYLVEMFAYKGYMYTIANSPYVGGNDTILRRSKTA